MTESPDSGPTSLIIISDFVCPWCYIGHLEIERLQERYDFAIDYAPFLLDPTTPPEGKPARFTRKAGDPLSPVEARAESLGIHFARGREWTSSSHLALEAAEFAADHPQRDAFHKAMFKAYFEDLADIGSIDTIVRVGDEVGLPAHELRRALEERAFTREVTEGVAWSRGIGVTGVPTFIFDERVGIAGAQTQDVFEGALREMGVAPRA
jgi:predicted DsbA family dithiol-disulfide isomerase